MRPSLATAGPRDLWRQNRRLERALSRGTDWPRGQRLVGPAKVEEVAQRICGSSLAGNSKGGKKKNALSTTSPKTPTEEAGH